MRISSDRVCGCCCTAPCTLLVVAVAGLLYGLLCLPAVDLVDLLGAGGVLAGGTIWETGGCSGSDNTASG